jgi:hypothetical protein
MSTRDRFPGQQGIEEGTGSVGAGVVGAVGAGEEGQGLLEGLGGGVQEAQGLELVAEGREAGGAGGVGVGTLEGWRVGWGLDACGNVIRRVSV